MAPADHVSVVLTRRNFFWSLAKESWLDLLTGSGLLLAVAVAWWSFHGLSLFQQVILWGLFIAALVVLSRRGWLKLFGPVLFYDLIRITRRSRYFWLRFSYASALAFVVYWQYSEWLGSTRATRGVIQGNLMSVFAEQFFNKFMVLQFLLIVVLTPAYAGGAIAEEKERKTLEFLLATDIRNREVVLSKLVSRLANLTLTVMTGLPILSVIQFLGGVDPDMVLAGFAATALTMLSLASLSLLHSVYARRPRDAILLTYLALAAYMGLGYLVEKLFDRPAIANWAKATSVGAFTFAERTIGIKLCTVEDLVAAFNAGNLPIVLSKLGEAWNAGTPLTNILPGMLRAYLIFHTLIAVICVGWAVARLRTIALKQSGGARRTVVLRARPRIRPRVALLPMVWKEIFVEPGFRLTPVGWLLVWLFVLISLFPGLWITACYLSDTAPPWSQVNYYLTARMGVGMPSYWTYSSLDKELNPWVRITGTVVACLMLLGVAARASTSISGERDRDTMDALLTSPLHSHDILFAKWLGSLLSVRWAWLWLGLIWTVGIVSGGLHPLAAVLTSVAWLIYASCFAGIGLWYSTACRTTLRATLCTMVTSVAAGVGPWAFCMCCFPAISLRSTTADLFWIQATFTPPAVLYFLSAPSYELGVNNQWDIGALLAYFSLFLWAFVSLFLWSITRTRFRRLTSRMPYRRPDAWTTYPARARRLVATEAKNA